ncbi:NAD-dependent succinate-semialdehyde dehydrogenase [Granulosicoccus antarcticus]|uniref:Succinate semialdehyde dehydrogenase [NAD(P)+] Sad n=1 Tax=Granulosicoccus antarcticus IMCC3135 TaxID=1192854 RepID=A0A2Z2NP25_9GAMM|nr:NAD-dependent succinate-semialdehyde dehydrogenase [Granulosicoccus antarcticus]ASJ72989.1 Succinate semialdehyde dehydrogenase [NAD(P)+] Sad [Granulosicoccus antarcticus IMCC3135]
MTKITTINPATEETIASYELMSKEAAFEKIDAAHTAFLGWREKTHEARAPYLRDIASGLRDNAEELAQLMTAETGKLLRDGLTEVELCAQIFEYTADKGPTELADEERTHSGGKKRSIVAYSPVGVIYSIQPWNFPIYQPVRVLAANLMAGNAVILKHAALCTGSGLKLLDICSKAGLPEGLFDVLLIDHDVSDEIIEHDRIRGVTMTGSDKAGRHIGQKATQNLKKSVLELGSNDAYLVLDDADVELAIKTCVQGRIYNNGETCVSAKRFVVTEAVYDEFVSGFVDQMKAITMGDPTSEDTQLGPVSSQEQFDTLVEQVEKSIAGGAQLLCGGDPAESVGQYFPATVLANCQPGTPAYDDELFGPVASIIKARDNEDAMRIANDSRYGLGGGIFSRDEDKALRLARDHFDTGMIRINSFGAADPNMPFGGVKDSGFGREHGGFGMKEFINVKSIYLP